MDCVKYNTLLNEKIYSKRLSNGMKCYIIPKAGYIEKQAILGINYGSADVTYKLDGRVQETPSGMAHFLEHKLFDDPQMNVFERFIALGGSVNAFTNFTTTAYYFSSNENFYECLRLLLEFTQRPYFTDETVAKEKPIIAQEIKMYEDNPFWVMYRGLLEALYESCPIRQNIAGSVEGIKAITAETLYACYGAFYRPENMVLVCTGEVEPERVTETAHKCVRRVKPMEVKRLYGREPRQASRAHTERTMPLARPMFQLGYKDVETTRMAERVAVTRILLDVIAGESSEFFTGLYAQGLVDGPFMLEYAAAAFYGLAVYSNSADRPLEVAKRLRDELKRLRRVGLDAERFERIRRKHLGRFIRSFNSIENISQGQMDLAFKGLDLFDLLRAYNSVSLAQAQARFMRLFREDNCATSVVGP